MTRTEAYSLVRRRVQRDLIPDLSFKGWDIKDLVVYFRICDKYSLDDFSTALQSLRYMIYSCGFDMDELKNVVKALSVADCVGVNQQIMNAYVTSGRVLNYPSLLNHILTEAVDLPQVSIEDNGNTSCSGSEIKDTIDDDKESWFERHETVLFIVGVIVAGIIGISLIFYFWGEYINEITILVVLGILLFIKTVLDFFKLGS